MIVYKTPVYIAITLCLMTIYGLFCVKDSVMTLRFELQEIKKQVVNEEDAIRILKAELAYLGSPERIQKLAYTHLELEKPKVTQMIKDPSLEDFEEKYQITESRSIRKNHKWRYKKGPAKYLTMAKGEK